MNNNSSLDRQNVLDNLTAIETTAKLLVNAFVKKNTDTDLIINGIHREELINQTTTFLEQAQKIILDISNTFNVPPDGFLQKLSKEKQTEISQNNEHEGLDSKSPPPKTSYSLSSITLEDIIQNRLTSNDLFPNYPLLHDPVQPNLVALARNIRQIENFDELITKVYSKIFNHEERLCCNYHGINGKLPYPRHKRLLFDLLIKLIFNERNKTFDEHEKQEIYTQCEKHFSTESPLGKYRGLNIDHLDDKNEKEFVCALFRLVIPQDDIKKILSAKQDLSSQWNDNETCIYHTRPIHLFYIKQKWMEKYPSNQSERWSQCIDWIFESFLETKKIRPSKRKTIEVPTDHKRTKTSLTLEEKLLQIDRSKFDVLEYASEFLQLISNENNQNLPTLQQLQLLETYISRYYWSPNQQTTWSQILDIINDLFVNESNATFRENYSKKLLEMNPNEQIEIEHLLQIVF